MTKAIKPGTRGWNPKQPKVLPFLNAVGTKVNLDPDKFDDVISGQGVRVRVYRTSYCPNVKTIDGAEHEIDCPLCHGEGFVDRYPLETWALFQSQAKEIRVNPEGIYDGNTVMATFMQNVELQYFNLVELMDFTDIYIERVKRQDGKVDVLRYPGVRVNLCMDQNGREYFEGSDFNLDPNGNMLWCAGRAPDRGTIYTIHYETAIRFRAYKAIHVNRFAQVAKGGQTHMVKMQECWMLSKSYQVTRKNLKGEVLQPNRISDPDDEED